MLLVCIFTEEFDNYMQQDAHEFLNFLINHINEIILGDYIERYILICTIIFLFYRDKINCDFFR